MTSGTAAGFLRSRPGIARNLRTDALPRCPCWRWRPGSASRRQLGLAADLGDAEAGEVGRNGRRTGVAEAQLEPDLAHGQAVAAERLLVALPHQHGGVLGPGVAG